MSNHKHMLRIIKSVVFGRLLKFKCVHCGAVKYFWRDDINSKVKGKVLDG